MWSTCNFCLTQLHECDDRVAYISMTYPRPPPYIALRSTSFSLPQNHKMRHQLRHVVYVNNDGGSVKI